MIEADEITAASEERRKRRSRADEAAIAKERAAIRPTSPSKAASARRSATGDRDALVPDDQPRAPSSCSSACSRPDKASPSHRPLDGHCSICHVRLRPQVYNTILRNEDIVQCDHCQRVLYFAGVRQRSAAGQAGDRRRDRHRQIDHDAAS